MFGFNIGPLFGGAPPIGFDYGPGGFGDLNLGSGNFGLDPFGGAGIGGGLDFGNDLFSDRKQGDGKQTGGRSWVDDLTQLIGAATPAIIAIFGNRAAYSAQGVQYGGTNPGGWQEVRNPQTGEVAYFPPGTQVPSQGPGMGTYLLLAGGGYLAYRFLRKSA